MASSTFSGFPPATLSFLGELRANNSKEWFDAHRDDYEAAYLRPAFAFVEALGDSLGDIAPAVVADPRVNGSVFRINRDIRFSKDKTPYKDHLDLWLWEGERKGAISGFFVRLTPDSLGMGVGCHRIPKERLGSFRALVDDPELAAAVAGIEAAGYAVSGSRYARVPAEAQPGTPLGERLARHDALYVHHDEPVDLALDPALVDTCRAHFTALAPLHRWLVDRLQ